MKQVELTNLAPEDVDLGGVVVITGVVPFDIAREFVSVLQVLAVVSRTGEAVRVVVRGIT